VKPQNFNAIGQMRAQGANFHAACFFDYLPCLF